MCMRTTVKLKLVLQYFAVRIIYITVMLGQPIQLDTLLLVRLEIGKSYIVKHAQLELLLEGTHNGTGYERN